MHTQKTMLETKKERKTILARIKESVLKSPKTMYELAKDLGSNWDTIRSNVGLLQQLGIITVQDGKVVSTQAQTSQNDETIAGLPVSEDSKKKVYALAKKFYAEWKNQTDKEPNNTLLQKALVGIADNFPELDIPRGWYLYGKVIFVKVNADKIKASKSDYDLKGIIPDMKRLDSKIKELVIHYKKMSTREIVQEQYTQHENKMYLIKKEIENQLLLGDLKNIKEALSKNLYELVFLFDIKKNDELSSEIYALIKDVITILILKLNDQEFMNRQNPKAILVELFNGLWKLIATYNLYATREGDLGYDPTVIKSFFDDKLNMISTEFLDQMQQLGINSS